MLWLRDWEGGPGQEPRSAAPARGVLRREVLRSCRAGGLPSRLEGTVPREYAPSFTCTSSSSPGSMSLMTL